MLEFLKLRMDGFGAGASAVSIWRSGGCLRYAYGSAVPVSDPPLIVRVPGKTAADFLERLQEIHVERWKGRYEKPAGEAVSVLDGASWSLSYQEAGKGIRRCSGRGAFPPQWGELIGLISTLMEETQASFLNRIARADFRLLYQQRVNVPGPTEGTQVQRILPYSEQLSIDRGTQTVFYRRDIEQSSVTHEYKVPAVIDYLLGNCERYLQDFSEKTYAKPDRSKPVLQVDIQYRGGGHQGFLRPYNRYGVPDDWDELLEDIRNTMSFYGIYGLFFDPACYRRGVKAGEYIYLSCVFEPNGKSYYYRTEDDTLSVGDLVLVPAGNDNRERISMISGIIYCTPENVPFPLEKTKMILRKYELGSSGEESGDFPEGDPEDMP